ncbi:MAG: FecR domain-containing protein [Dysgonamonadaceae bacterium]|jgi:ferric-dicitrate binding protein FerR (iron transport regulator)|nr:FecR domain-containing protein [Dysgonamonadaceae bacterium]
MQTTEEKNIDELISLYLSGGLDQAELEALKQWSLQSEANRKYVRNQFEIWFSSGISDDSVTFDKEKAFELFKQRVNQAMKEKNNTRFTWSRFYRVAAIILILVLPPTAYWQGRKTVKQTFAETTIEVPTGARTKLSLPDGTLVWLNAGSKMLYSQRFGVDDRKLKLEGEGYFEVVTNKKIPFVIQTKEVDLKVLGTKFNFKNYPEDEEVIVDLVEGTVALQHGATEFLLEADEKLVLNKITKQMTKTKTNAEFANVWANDELFFDEELLVDIAKELMRCYDAKIVVADSSQQKRFYGSFKVSENTIDEVLGTIASTNRMKYRYENGIHILY